MARNALMDFLQSASNEAAGAISGPVDLLGMGLRGIGVPVPKNALLSSDWMAQRGLTRPVPNGAAQVAGATAGLLSPVAVAAKAPQIARGLLQAGQNMAAPSMQGAMGQRGAIVYHGSPHKFDAFDSSKIGTGEGAQAYGHGLYLAEDPRVAQSYKEALGAGRGDSDADTIARVLDAVGGDSAKAAAEFQRRAQYANIPGGKERLLSLAEQARSGVDPRGALYKVDLPDEKIARFLDWDKPLSQQAPEVQRAMRQAVDATDAEESTARWLLERGNDPHAGALFKATGASTPGVNKMADYPGSAALSEWLRKQGIPGIRYLDGGSRGAGGGTSNFVVFPGEENALKILERNGKTLR